MRQFGNLGRYLFAFFVTTLGLVILSALTSLATGYGLPSFLMQISSAALAAAYAGQKRKERGHEPLSGREAWKTALGFSVVALIILTAISLLDPATRVTIDILPPKWLLLAIIEQFLFFTLINRIFLALGQSLARQADRQGAEK